MSVCAVLKAGRDRSLRRRHPWIFSGAIERIAGAPASGDTVAVATQDGERLALAAWSPDSQIRGRVWSFDLEDTIDERFFRARIEQAVAMRDALPAARHSNALRLVHAESDNLPGLVVDRYADVLVAQFLSAGAERWRETILDALVEATGCEAIYERSDAEVRALEGLAPRVGFARGNRGAGRCAIVEHGLNFRVDVEQGQKTGFFLDQRENRQRVRAIAGGRAVLDCFCYTGGFAIAALAGGAKRVLGVESSSVALEVARENLSANLLADDRFELRQADVFEHLRALRDRRYSIRPSARRPRRRRVMPRGRTRTSTCWRSSCFRPVAYWRRFRARVACRRNFFSRSSPARRSMQAWMGRLSNGLALPQTIRWRSSSRKATT